MPGTPPYHVLRRQHLWHVLVVTLLGPYLLSALSIVGQGKLAQKTTWNGVGASSFHSDQAFAKRGHRAALAAVHEAFDRGNSIAGSQHIYLAADSSLASSSNATQNSTTTETSYASASISSFLPASTSGIANVISGTNIANRTSQSSSQVASTSQNTSDIYRQRWGQSAAYLQSANSILFTGGQVVTADSGESISNDVFALQLATSGNTTQTNWHQGYSWIQLSAQDAPSHAFSARALTRSKDEHEQYFLIGGATNNCSLDASTIHLWKAGSGENWKEGSWIALSSANTTGQPPRRRGASALQVPAQLGLHSSNFSADSAPNPSFMVFGGEVDDSTCSNTDNGDVSVYSNVDVWTVKNSTVNSTSGSDAALQLEVRTLPLDTRMPNMSLVDYSAVVLPANTTNKNGMRVLFIGGRGIDGNLTPLDKLWALDVDSNGWVQIDASANSTSNSSLPTGRVGHSSTLLEDGSVLVYGGYTSLNSSGVASDDTYLLSMFNGSLASWQRVADTQSAKQARTSTSLTKGRAFHSAILVDGVLVAAFGEQRVEMSELTESFNASKFDRRAVNSTAADAGSTSLVQFLDTRSRKAWEWTTDYAAILESRLADASAITTSSATSMSSTAAPTSTSFASQSFPSVSATSSTQDNSGARTSSIPQTSSEGNNRSAKRPSAQTTSQLDTGAASASQAPYTNADPSSTSAMTEPSPPSKAPSSVPTHDEQGKGTDGQDHGQESTTKTTTVVASVLGAAAAVAVLAVGAAGYRRWQAKHRDADGASIDDGKYERYNSDGNNAQKAPFVSSLWINQPVTWAASAGRGMKRQADNVSDTFLNRSLSKRQPRNGGSGTPGASPWRDNGFSDSSYTLPPAGERSFQVIRNSPYAGRLGARHSERIEQESRRRRLEDYDGAANETYDSDGLFDVLDQDSAPNASDRMHPDKFMSRITDDENARTRVDLQQPMNGDVSFGAHDTWPLDSNGLYGERRPSAVTLSQMSGGDAASHFSYPYLTAMHQSSRGNDINDAAEESHSPSTNAASAYTEGDGFGGKAVFDNSPTPDNGKNAQLASKVEGHNRRLSAHSDPFNDDNRIVFSANNMGTPQEREPTELDFGASEIGTTMLPWASSGNRITNRPQTLLSPSGSHNAGSRSTELPRPQGPRSAARPRRERPSLLRITNASSSSLER